MAVRAGRGLYLSGITLSLYDWFGRDRLAHTAAAVRRAGGRVAFDPNYRPVGWSDAVAAKTAMDDFAHHVDIVLPTFDDERLPHADITPRDTIARWQALGVGEIVVKTGRSGCLLVGEAGPIEIAPVASIRPIDTTGAGDSFNAAYLTARLAGRPTTAAIAGNSLAGHVIGHVGAIGAMPAFN